VQGYGSGWRIGSDRFGTPREPECRMGPNGIDLIIGDKMAVVKKIGRYELFYRSRGVGRRPTTGLKTTETIAPEYYSYDCRQYIKCDSNDSYNIQYTGAL